MFQNNILAAKTKEEPNNIVITLKIEVALRIPHNIILVNIKKVDGDYVLQTDTKTLEGHPKDRYPEFHDSKTISEKWFETFSKLEKNLTWKKLKKKENNIVLDGSDWALTYKYGDIEKTVNIWSPDFETNKRGLESYLEICRFILKSADFDPETLLPKEN
jgi:predicted nuclease of restriction endonuclease-like RecB superfamily